LTEVSDRFLGADGIFCVFCVLFGLALEVILSQVTSLAHAVGVVGFVRVGALAGQLLLPTDMVALMTHLAGILFLVAVGTHHHGWTLSYWGCNCLWGLF
jgi:hypothetical protein